MKNLKGYNCIKTARGECPPCPPVKDKKRTRQFCIFGHGIDIDPLIPSYEKLPPVNARTDTYTIQRKKRAEKGIVHCRHGIFTDPFKSAIHDTTDDVGGTIPPNTPQTPAEFKAGAKSEKVKHQRGFFYAQGAVTGWMRENSFFLDTPRNRLAPLCLTTKIKDVVSQHLECLTPSDILSDKVV